MSTALVTYDSSDSFLQQVNSFPMLSADDEHNLAVDFYENGNVDAAHRLVQSYLRYVVSIAKDYSGYNVPFRDLIQEGTVGLMKAVQKFDPYKGVRLATYAMWWIKAAINEFILDFWSLVKIGTSQAKRKLFFNVRKYRTSIEGLTGPEIKQLSDRFDVSEDVVLEIESRMSHRDESLNTPLLEDSSMEKQDYLVDSRPNQEVLLLESDEQRYHREVLSTALENLTERERTVIHYRFFSDPTKTLEEIGKELGVSRERVRQLEKKAIGKLKEAIPTFDGFS